jgi:hypothetical protein
VAQIVECCYGCLCIVIRGGYTYYVIATGSKKRLETKPEEKTGNKKKPETKNPETTKQNRK